MKRIIKYLASTVAVMAVGFGFQSCVSESPFSTLGDGTLRLRASVNGDVKVSTRADDDDKSAKYDQATLENNLVVYIERPENNIGLVRKFLGKSNIPPAISLAAGNYVVEAWTGDSVSASFDKKFYRCYQPVTIKADQEQNLQVKCNIANVIVSVDEESLNAGISEMNVAFFHSRKDAESLNDRAYVMNFNETNIRGGARAFFMMPNKVDEGGRILPEKENVLNYIISGKGADGSEYTKTGVIENVQAAYEYKVKIVADKSTSSEGGALIRLEIMEIPVIDETVVVFPAPEYTAVYGQTEQDLTNSFVLTDNVYDAKLFVKGYKGLKTFSLSFSNNFTGMESVSGVNLMSDDNVRSMLESKGIRVDIENKEEPVKESPEENAKVSVCEVTVVFTQSYLSSLAEDASEYLVTVKATDNSDYNKSSSAELSFANTVTAIRRQDPVNSLDMTRNENIDYRNLSPYRATLLGIVNNEEAADYGIQYRVAGSESGWTKVPATGVRAGAAATFSVTVTGLNPATSYEYKAYSGEFEEKNVRTFTTESIFTIPNSGMEEWSEFKENTKVLIPGPDGVRSFWDSGNHGSATLNETLTQGNESMYHGGAKCAELKSKYVAFMGIGKFAAGNLFAGTYKETKGTNGKIDFGREFNGSHPSALKLWANYRPGSKLKGNGLANGEKVLTDGENDYSQIYVAFTTGVVTVDTSNVDSLFDPNADYVLGYGEITWHDNFGEDGRLKEVSIPIRWTDGAKTQKPTHIIIVCSASKYGDFFTGCEGSVMYVDDFELVYE